MPETTLPDRLGDELARHRLRHRVRRLDRVVEALERRAQGYDSPPRALRLAMEDFRRERETLRAQWERLSGARPAASGSGPSPRTGRSSRTASGR